MAAVFFRYKVEVSVRNDWVIKSEKKGKVAFLFLRYKTEKYTIFGCFGRNRGRSERRLILRS